jgi:hypothetical protein
MTSFNVNSLTNEEKFALFYGIMMGDGCLSYCIQKRGSWKPRVMFMISITGSSVDDRDFF